MSSTECPCSLYFNTKDAARRMAKGGTPKNESSSHKSRCNPLSETPTLREGKQRLMRYGYTYGKTGKRRSFRAADVIRVNLELQMIYILP